MLISNFASRRMKDSTFFDGDRKSPWFLVAFGMIGSGISAVSLVSIPGNVGNNNLYYFQFILGTIVGYLFIAFVLTPIYYKLKLVSIYAYLNIRFGNVTYKTGSLFFLYPNPSVPHSDCFYQLKSCNLHFLMLYIFTIP